MSESATGGVIASGLTFSDYQEQALKSDRLVKVGDLGRDVALPLFGLVGEAGELAAELKKRERDKAGYVGFENSVREELGDALWYMAAIADRVGLTLVDIAESNLVKVVGEYQASQPPKPHALYDDGVPEKEQLPRQLAVRFDERIERNDGLDVAVVNVTVLNAVLKYQRPLGDPINDNSDIDDFYRYHDSFHLAHMAILGWSPVVRTTMQPKLKRRTDSRTDRVEDGGRAIVIEEGLTAAVFAEARDHSYFKSTERIPRDLLKSCMKVTSHLEVKNRTIADWQHAILAGYKAFNFLVEHHGGVLVADMRERTLKPYTINEYESLIAAITTRD